MIIITICWWVFCALILENFKYAREVRPLFFTLCQLKIAGFLISTVFIGGEEK
jgi:hypothetical protein